MERYAVCDQKVLARLGLACAVLVYLAAFFFPVGERAGWEIFVLGAIAMMPPITIVGWPWLANVAFLLGCIWLLSGQPGTACWVGLGGTALALGFLAIAQSGLVGSEATAAGSGYWVWLLSMVLLAGAGWIGIKPGDVATLTSSFKEVTSSAAGDKRYLA